MALDFRQYNPDIHGVPDLPGLPDLPPPNAPLLQREGYRVPRIPVSELKTRLSAALSRTNTPLNSNEQRALRVALDKLVNEMSEGLVLIDDMYEIPLILSQVEAIPLYAKRGIRGNGGSRKRSGIHTSSYRMRGGSRKRSLSKRSGHKRTLRKTLRMRKTHRK
jgi:hypothetical protein